MLAASVAATLAAVTVVGGGDSGSEWSPQRLLAGRQAPQRVVTHVNDAAGLWSPTYPLGSRRQGSARYGVDDPHAVVFVRVGGQQVVALRPWTPLRQAGLERLERARTLWLRDQGLVLAVRTHVNGAVAQQREADTSPPRPRATIRIAPPHRRGGDVWAGRRRGGGVVRVVEAALEERGTKAVRR
ncbi:MAG: hypothetical protein D6824_05465 [Planctomycetota bacterium]|nr:MAG: hypothetical protein D6824_05465 [Planctomycetota bacterium]